MQSKQLGCVTALTLLCSGVWGCGDDLDFRLPDPAVRYIAFGDSSTQGPSDKDYVDFLTDLLGEDPSKFSNEGKGGETSSEGVQRLQSLISRGLFPNAEVLLFWEGGNSLTDFVQEHDPLLTSSPDSAQYAFSSQLKEQLDAMQADIEDAARIGKEAGLQVFVATYYFLPPTSLDCDALPLHIMFARQSANANRYVTQLNERIRLAAANQGAVLVDVASRNDDLQSNTANYFDCNHLSDSGNEIVANVFFEALTP